MSLWNSITEKASDISDIASKKAEDAKQISNLNAIIRKEEKAIEELYIKIGKEFVSLYGDDPENDFSEWIGEIREAEEHAKDCRKRIEYIKKSGGE